RPLRRNLSPVGVRVSWSRLDHNEVSAGEIGLNRPEDVIPITARRRRRTHLPTSRRGPIGPRADANQGRWSKHWRDVMKMLFAALALAALIALPTFTPPANAVRELKPRCRGLGRGETRERSPRMNEEDPHWPALPLAAWEPTRATLHMWTQVVGKVRLALSPYMNHWWHVPLYVTARGLTTSPIPYQGETFEIVLDFIEHNLLIQKDDGTAKTLRLAPKSVAEFYADLMAALRSLDIAVKIWTMPVEIPNPIPFDQDRTHASYDRDYANRFWRILVS